MVEFSEEKEERLIELAKELRKKKYNWSQISKTYGIPEKWFTERLEKKSKLK